MTVSNAANAGPTSGKVTVTETIPAGLTLVSMAGTGWACSGYTCTRSDALNGGGSYPAITVTVNVAANAPSQVINQVSVSGGGAASASASDATTINAVVCTYGISPVGITPAASGGSYSVAVTAPAGCSWTAASNAAWLSIASGASGTGIDTVNCSVATNTGASSRTGTLTIAGQTFTVNQAGNSSSPSTALSNIGIFRAFGGQGLWVLDNGNNNYDAGDKGHFFGLPGDQPVVGDWSGNGQTRLGVFRSGLWYLDLNNNGQWDGVAGGDGVYAFGLPGDIAAVGDWNGDGRTKLGVFRCPQPGAGACLWVLDVAGKFYYDPATAKGFTYGLPGDTPVVNNWNGTSNVDQIGIYRPMPNGFGLWIVDSDGSGAWELTDAQFWYGLAADVPVVGNWNNGTRKRIGVFRGGLWILDTNGNNAYDASDATGSFGSPGDKPAAGNWSIP